MVHFVNMTRLTIERRAISVMQLVASGVEAHDLLQPKRFGRIILERTMCLRQPGPDKTLADVGRFARGEERSTYQRKRSRLLGWRNKTCISSAAVH